MAEPPRDSEDRATAHSTGDSPDYNADGVDLTLIRWMLSLTPLQRLENLQHLVGSLKRMCHGRRNA
jgi:hypothetical protein